MTGDRPAAYLLSLVNELRALPRETEWVEFKINDAQPQAIGEYIAALANGRRWQAKPLPISFGAFAMRTTP